MPLLALAFLASQAPTTLETYLKAHPPAGPWLAVDAARVTSTKPTDLAAFDRKAVRIGGITAIVPRTMVVVPDLSQTPTDPYASFSRQVKLLTLMASLDDAQRRKMVGGGIGLDDLGREQRAFFESLLPRPLRWRGLSLVDGRAVDGSKDAKGALSETERAKVRLRTFRTLQLQVPKAGTRSRYSLWPELPPGLKGKGAETWFQLDLAEGIEGERERGVAPNAPKASGLRAGTLAGAIVGPRRANLGSFLRDAVRAPELLADRRVAPLEVTLSAGTFRAADLLPALALAVTGTYRPVGGAFVLASDLEGTASRWARNQSVLARENAAAFDATAELYETLRASGALKAVAFSKDDPLAPPDGLAGSLDEIDPKTSQTALVSRDELSPAMRAEVERLVRANPDADSSQVGVSSEINFHFVLPGGRDVMAEPPFSIAQTAQYAFSRAAAKARDARLDARPPTRPLAAFALPEGNAVALAVSVESPSEADEAVRLVQTFGFGELWLETHRSEVLTRALATPGLGVRLIVRPWTAPPGAKVADPDRTLIGETAAAWAARMAASSPTGLIWNAPAPGGRELLAPRAARWEGLAALGKTPGLKGVVLLDVAPPGYRPSTAFGADANGFGYSGGGRLAFLRAQGLDPVDVLDPRRGIASLPNLPFFSIEEDGKAAKGLGLTRKDAEAWSRFRIDENAQALGSLSAALEGVPLLVPDEEGRPSQNRAILRENPGLEDLRRASTMLRRRRAEGETGVLDLSGVPAPKRAALLSLLLKRRTG